MLINMRNGLMAGKRLPYDAEVEYLEATGNTVDDGTSVWIPTDIILSNNPIIEVSAQPTSFSTFSWVVGARRFNAPYIYCLIGINQTGYARAVYGDGTARNGNSIVLSTNAFNTIRVAKNGLFVNGIVQNSYSQSVGSQFSYGPGLALFATSQIGGATSQGIGLTGRIAWCKVWNDDGATLVGDVIMVRKDGIGYAYNKVYGVLYGATNGTLVIGPDI